MFTATKTDGGPVLDRRVLAGHDVKETGVSMARLSVNDVMESTGGVLRSGGGGMVAGVSTDTRTLTEGFLFVPLVGERFDGHDFLEDAVKSGAAGVLVEAGRRFEPAGECFVVEVPDTLLALQSIASFVRRMYPDKKVVGITGSNGKTTTKEMLASIMDLRGPVLKNAGNLNNHIGLPLTLTGLNESHWAAVLEMGMNAPGEIARLTEIAMPDVGVITNVGQAHIGMLGSVEAVARAKAELVEGMGEGGIPVINADDPNLSWITEGLGGRAVTFGMSEGADCTAEDIVSGPGGVSFRLVMPDGVAETNLPVMGQYNVMNALAAAAAAGELGFSVEDCSEGLAKFTPPPMRMQVLDAAGVRLINDAYNANPSSMAASLTALFMYPALNKIAVIGDMLELGEKAAEAHRNVGRLAGSGGLSFLVVMGEFAREVVEGALEAGMDPRDVLAAATHDEAAYAVMSRVKEGDAVLVKGSRGMRLEDTVKKILDGRAKA